MKQSSIVNHQSSIVNPTGAKKNRPTLIVQGRPSLFIHAGSRSGGKARTTAAALNGIRVVEGKPSFLEPVVEVDGGSVEEQPALLVDGHRQSVLLGKLGELSRRIKELERKLHDRGEAES